MNQKWIVGICIVNLVGIIVVGLYLGLGLGKSGKDPVFIDLQKVYNEFTYKIEIEELLKQENQKRRYKSDSLQAVLETGMTNGLLNPEEKLRLEGELNRSVTEYQEGMQQLTNHYDQLIWNAINKYVSEYGKANGSQLILGSKGEGNIMYAEEGKDISAEVITYINTAYQNEKK